MSKSSLLSKNGKSKLYYVQISKDDMENYKRNVGNGSRGEIIRKIWKLFEDNPDDGEMIKYLKKKGVGLDNNEWNKFVVKVNKNSNIVYILIGRTKIIGAFHVQRVNIEGEASIWD
jgi:hypothetical protein